MSEADRTAWAAQMTITRLKAEARKHYGRYCAAVGYLDCGRTLAEYLIPDAAIHKQKFNEIVDEIAKLDPFCPKDRL